MATQKKGKGNGTKILVSLAVLIFAGGVFTVASLALFTDQQAVGGNAFSAGTIDLVAAPGSAVVTMSDMAPGDEVTNSITVTNSGSLDFRYSVSSQTTENVFAAELDLTIRTGVTTCDNANWDLTGTQIFTGPLGSTTLTPIIGDPAVGDDLGDRVIAAGLNEVLCINVTLPLAATNASQGLSTTATLTFDAEQTANNP